MQRAPQEEFVPQAEHVHQEEPVAKRPRLTEVTLSKQSVPQEELVSKRPRLTEVTSEVTPYAIELHGILGVPHQTVVPRLFATRPGFLIIKPAGL